MRWYSYVPEENAEEGAVFAPTIEINFKDDVADDSVVRLCLSYRPAVTLGTNGETNTANDGSDLEVMCAYTETSWKAQDWEIKWAKQIQPKNLPKFVAGTTNEGMATDQVVIVAETGWGLEAAYLDKSSGSKNVLLDLTRWQDILQIDDKTDSINPLIMYPSSGDSTNEIELVFSYAIYSAGDLSSYPTDQVKGDITTTSANADESTIGTFTYSKQTFTILNAQDSSMYLKYTLATTAAVISTFASLI